MMALVSLYSTSRVYFPKGSSSDNATDQQVNARALANWKRGNLICSSLVMWACVMGRVELAKMLVKHGADSHATTPSVFDHKPPSCLARKNGQLLAVKYLNEECGHDNHECNIRVSLRHNSKVWA